MVRLICVCSARGVSTVVMNAACEEDEKKDEKKDERKRTGKRNNCRVFLVSLSSVWMDACRRSRDFFFTHAYIHTCIIGKILMIEVIFSLTSNAKADIDIRNSYPDDENFRMMMEREITFYRYRHFIIVRVNF